MLWFCQQLFKLLGFWSCLGTHCCVTVRCDDVSAVRCIAVFVSLDDNRCVFFVSWCRAGPGVWRFDDALEPGAALEYTHIVWMYSIRFTWECTLFDSIVLSCLRCCMKFTRGFLRVCSRLRFVAAHGSLIPDIHMPAAASHIIFVGLFSPPVPWLTSGRCYAPLCRQVFGMTCTLVVGG